jgi:hypothetical protein
MEGEARDANRGKTNDAARKKGPGAGGGGGLFSVASNGLYRTAFHGFLAEGFLFGGFRLFVHVRMSPVVIPLKVGGSRFAAQIAVDALVIDVKRSGYVLRIAV